MSDTPEQFTYHVDGSEEYGGEVLLEDFAASFAELVESLHRTALALDSTTRVRWTIAEVTKGSLNIAARPVADTPVGFYVAQESSRLVITAINHGAYGEDPGETLPESAAKPMRRFLQIVRNSEMPTYRVTHGDLTAIVAPRSQGDQPPRPVTFRTATAIEGVIVSVSFAAANPSFSIRTIGQTNLVTCYFDPQRHYRLIADNMLGRIAVIGMVTQRADGEITTIGSIEDIFVFPTQDNLPQPDDMVGIAPNMTDGLPAEEWIRRERSRG